MSLTISPTLRRLRAELKTAVDALAEERQRYQNVAHMYELVGNQRDDEVKARMRLAGELATIKGKLQLSERALDLSRHHAANVFERHHFEAMSREQLVSFAEGAINEARRKGLIEAEGLATRQFKLSKETDLDLMRGVVKEYQSRIAEVETELKEAAHTGAMTKVDTRPLSAKLETFKAPTWWEVKPLTGFIPFDQKANAVTAAAKAKQPHELRDGSSVVVPGTTGGHYVLERRGNVYSCTCPAWRYNREVPERRTCKHLETYLGESTEGVRITSYLRAKCHCGEILVRGQCQVHTRDWKGDELCKCGRKFASCKAAYDTISIAQRRFGHQPELTK